MSSRPRLVPLPLASSFSLSLSGRSQLPLISPPNPIRLLSSPPCQSHLLSLLVLFGPLGFHLIILTIILTSINQAREGSSSWFLVSDSQRIIILSRPRYLAAHNKRRIQLSSSCWETCLPETIASSLAIQRQSAHSSAQYAFCTPS